MKTRAYLALKDNLLKIFLTDKKLLKSTEGDLRNEKGTLNFKITFYEGFYTIEFVNLATLIYLSTDSKIKPHPDFIDITDNEKFTLSNIATGKIYNANLVIEGSDGVGKSTLVANLAQRGILCQDRAVNEITKKMKPEIGTLERVLSVEQFLTQDLQRKLVFIYMSDEKELEARIQKRGMVSKYDKQALRFQQLYLDTYRRFENYPNIYLIDCLNKSRDDMVNEILYILVKSEKKLE